VRSGAEPGDGAGGGGQPRQRRRGVGGAECKPHHRSAGDGGAGGNAALAVIPHPNVGESKQLRARRKRAAARYRPETIDLLLVAEAPPSASDRYFYYEKVRKHDSLFRYVAKMMLGTSATRENKRELLARFKESRVFLIDLCLDPICGRSLKLCVPDLVRRCQQLRPQKIVLIKTRVFDAAYEALVRAGLPVIDQRIPFPGSGQQLKFCDAFARALRKLEWALPPVSGT